MKVRTQGLWIVAVGTFACACGEQAPALLPPEEQLTLGDAAMPPPAIRPAALPTLTPCPEGWTPRSEDDITWCDPWPGGSAEECAPDHAHFPGAPACEPLGSPCPRGDLPEGLPAGTATVYVVAGAKGGTGTREAPFGTLAEGLTAVPPDGILAIGKGDYDTPLVIRKPVTLWGACVADTRLTSSERAALLGVLNIESPGVHIRNLTIGPAERHGVWAIAPEALVTMNSVLVDRARGIGVEFEFGAELEAKNLVVRGTRDRGDGMGRGLGVETGAHAHVRRAVFEGNDEFGAFTYGTGTLLQMEDVVIRDTGPRPSDGRGGPGIMAWTGSEMEIRRGLIEGSRAAAAIVDARGTRVLLEDSIIRDVVAETDGGPGGRGANISDNAVFEMRRGLIEHTRGSAIIAGLGGRAIVEDTILRDGIPEDYIGRSARGVTAQHAGAATLSRVLLLRSVEMGIMVGMDRAHLEFNDLTIRDTLEQLDGVNGRGLNVQNGGAVTGARLSLENGYQVGLTVFDENSHVELTDVTVSHVQRGDLTGLALPPGSEGGYGVGCYRAGSLVIRGFSIEDSAICGVHFDSPDIQLSHGTVSGSTIGACVQVDGFDITRLSDDVHFLDNASNLDATDLPVPLPGETL